MPYEQAQALKLRCKTGVLEMCGQSLKLVWPHDLHNVDSRYEPGKVSERVEEVLVPPVYLERATAANEFAALEDVSRAELGGSFRNDEDHEVDRPLLAGR